MKQEPEATEDPPNPDHDSRSRGAGRFLNWIERAGNRLPDPLILFVLFAAIIPFVSWFFAAIRWSVIHPVTGAPIISVNLLQADQVQRMFTEAVPNFTSFPPLGTVLVAMMGIGVAERSGLISALLKLMVTAVPRTLITGAVVFAGVMSSMAADAGYVVLTPLGAVVFASLGRHPLAGLCAAFAGVSGGFSANLLLTSLDPLLAGFTQSAAQLYDPVYVVNATANYYFMVASVFLITAVAWVVTDWVVEPRLGKWDPSHSNMVEEGTAQAGVGLSGEQRRALWGALAAFLLTLGALSLLVVPVDGILRDPEGGLAPFYQSIVPMLAIAFIIPGLVYGMVSGSIRNSQAVARMTGETMATMGTYIVLAFAAAQFVAYFGWSNLGLMFAVSGAQFLKDIGLGAIPLLIGIVGLSSLINLFIGSASAKWGLMSPVLVPMLMNLGFSPELAQACYRVGDSITNIITPLMPYFPIIIAFAQKYDSRIRLGTLISSMLPYSIAFAVSWVIMLIVWYLLGLPLGPDAPILYQPAGSGGL
jgi:aminobenzoyl-glutamate transport protein